MKGRESNMKFVILATANGGKCGHLESNGQLSSIYHLFLCVDEKMNER